MLAAATTKLIANDAIYSSMLNSDTLEEEEEGDDSDTTRQCHFYDELWKYLKKVGIDEL